MCGIDFVMAVTHKEAAKADKNVHFDERIHQYLLKQAIQQKGQKLDLLLNIKPYGTEIIYTKDIPKLIKICETLFSKYDVNDEWGQKIKSFAKELNEMCEEAIKLKKHLYAIGD